jgi:hypothetical protein
VLTARTALYEHRDAHDIYPYDHCRDRHEALMRKAVPDNEDETRPHERVEHPDPVLKQAGEWQPYQAGENADGERKGRRIGEKEWNRNRVDEQRRCDRVEENATEEFPVLARPRRSSPVKRATPTGGRHRSWHFVMDSRRFG